MSRPAVRFAWGEPRQERARESMRRFAAAAEALLRTRPFDQIAIQDIARRAGRTTGSFYTHFESKEALLPYLYARYDAALEGLLERRRSRVDWSRLDFEGTIAAMVRLSIGVYLEKRWLIRAMALFARTHPHALPEDIHPRRARIQSRWVRLLDRHRDRIGHHDVDSAVRFALFMLASTLREKLIFPEAPYAVATPVTRADLEIFLTGALCRFLEAGAIPGRPAATPRREIRLPRTGRSAARKPGGDA